MSTDNANLPNSIDAFKTHLAQAPLEEIQSIFQHQMTAFMYASLGLHITLEALAKHQAPSHKLASFTHMLGMIATPEISARLGLFMPDGSLNIQAHFAEVVHQQKPQPPKPTEAYVPPKIKERNRRQSQTDEIMAEADTTNVQSIFRPRSN